MRAANSGFVANPASAGTPPPRTGPDHRSMSAADTTPCRRVCAPPRWCRSKHSDLAVLDPPRGAGVLPLHPDHAHPRSRPPPASPRGHRDDPLRLPARRPAPHRHPAPPATAGPASHPASSPACSAIVQQFLRGRSAGSPSTNALARRRGSTRRNRFATRAISPSKTSRQPDGSTSAGSTMTSAATTRSRFVHPTTHDQLAAAPVSRHPSPAKTPKSGWSTNPR